MKRWRTAIAMVGSAHLVVSLAGCGVDETISCVAGSPTCPSDEFKGLSGEVRILRDALGVVHVEASTDADVYYGSGYAQAVDRLFEMDLMRRRALGRSAEVLGPDAVSGDTLLRTMGLPRMGRENAELLRKERPDLYEQVVAWTAGVNARIEEVRSGKVPLPYGFGPEELAYTPEPWSPVDAMTNGKLLLFGNANGISYELLASILRDYFPDLAQAPLLASLEAAYILPPEERPELGAPLSHPGAPGGPGLPLPDGAAERLAAFVRKMASEHPAGSNNWAIDGRHTKNKRPIVAGDPHQRLESPSVMWAQHMNSAEQGGSVDVVGFSFVGSPGVHLGHNRNVAWSATTNYPDVMDIWHVAVDQGVAHVGGVEVPVATHTETIEVRDAPAQTIEIAEVPGYGVILPDGLAPLPIGPPGHRLLLGWPGFAPTHEFEAFAAMISANDLGAMEDAVDRMEIGNFNFVFATADGIAYRSSPLVPDRGVTDETIEPYAVLDGADASKLWTGAMLPLERMPHSRGGERGWITSSNNDPYGFTSDGSLVGDPFYFGVFFDPGARAARIESEIERMIAEGPVTVEDAQRLQMDTYTRLADRLVPLLQQVWATVDTDETLAPFRGRDDLASLVAEIGAWDRRMDHGSGAALAYHAFMSFAMKRTLADDFGVAFDSVATESPIYMLKLAVRALTGAYEGSDAYLQEGGPLIVVQALDDTAALLTERFGSTSTRNVAWSDFHETHFRSVWGDVLDGGSYATSGSDGTVNVSAAPFFDGANVVAKHVSHSGAVYRMVQTFDDDGVPSATVNYPRGNSGDPASAHFDDTVVDWVEGVYRPLLFRSSEVEAGSTVEYLLEP